MMIAGFILAHICLLLILLGVVFPRYYDIFIPTERRAEGTEKTIANEPKEQDFIPDVGVFDSESGMPELLERKSSERIVTEHSTARSKP
jgi:solute carrier family 6 GABA transporter-like protein 1